MPVETAPLGSQGLRVPRIGVGIMSAAFYGSGDPAADEASQLAAIDVLVDICKPTPAFLDTAWIYAHPTGLHSEEIVGKAIAKHGREAFVIATKFGISASSPPVDSSLATIEAQYADSVRRLGTTPDLYYQHRPDPVRPTEEVVADLAAMAAAGKFRYIGLSECTPEELRRAHAVFPITAIQMEWSLAERGIEGSLLPVCEELGIGIVAYSPLARGLLTTAVAKEALDASDRRRGMPRWAEGAFEANAGKASSLAAIAARKGCTPAQLALAWLLAKSPVCFPIPGSKTPARVRENLGALDIHLTDEDVAKIEGLDLKSEGARAHTSLAAHTWEARAAAAAGSGATAGP